LQVYRRCCPSAKEVLVRRPPTHRNAGLVGTGGPSGSIGDPNRTTFELKLNMSADWLVGGRTANA